MLRQRGPSVSAIIPCYNAGRFIRNAISSVTSQTVKPAEILLVDDGSTDDSAKVAQEFGRSVTVIRQENKGEGAARNRGLDEARGKWIAFLNADDVWEPQKLEIQMAAVEAEKSIVCCHSGFYLLGETTPKIPISRKPDYRIEMMLLNPTVNSSTAIVRADVPVRFPVGVS